MTEPGILMPEHEAPRYENVESSDHTAGLEEFRNHNNNERACDDIVKPNIVENSLPSVNQNTDVIAADTTWRERVEQEMAALRDQIIALRKDIPSTVDKASGGLELPGQETKSAPDFELSTLKINCAIKVCTKNTFYPFSKVLKASDLNSNHPELHVISILMESPRIANQASRMSSRTKLPSEPKGDLDGIPDSGLVNATEMELVPTRVRIRSVLLLDLLEHICRNPEALGHRSPPKNQEPVEDHVSFVFLHPFKFFVTYETDIRAYATELKQQFEDGTNINELEPHVSDSKSANSEESTVSESQGQSSGSPARFRTKKAHHELQLLIKLFDEHLAPVFQLRKALRSGEQPKISFENLWLLFELGDILYKKNQDKKIPAMLAKLTSISGGRTILNSDPWNPQDPLLKQKEKETSTFAKDSGGCEGLFCLRYFHIDSDGATIGPSEWLLSIPPWDGDREVRDLQVFPTTFCEEKVDFAEDSFESWASQKIVEGKKFQRLKPGEQKFYEGETFTADTIPQDHRTHVIIDINEARRQAPSLFSIESNPISLWIRNIAQLPLSTSLYVYKGDMREVEEDRRAFNTTYPKDIRIVLDLIHDDVSFDYRLAVKHKDGLGPISTTHRRVEGKLDPNFKEEYYLLFPGLVPGFLLSTRSWANLKISGLKRCKRDKRVWKELKLPEGYKEALLSSVEPHLRSHSAKVPQADLIQGKGTGTIILLHGPPGVGKTLTVEAIAAYTGKALYPMTFGDLGSNAVDVEKNLGTILRRGQKWGCIILLDEADVFFVTRSPEDLVRNSIVSIFLRRFEYYSGIIFLTTNRLKELDPGILSRVTMPLIYPPLSKQATRDIWCTYMDDIKRFLPDASAHHDPNSTIKPRLDPEIRNWWEDKYDEAAKPAENATPPQKPKYWWSGRQIQSCFRQAVSFALHDEQIKRARSRSRRKERAEGCLHLKTRHFDRVAAIYQTFDTESAQITENEVYRPLVENGTVHRHGRQRSRSSSSSSSSIPFSSSSDSESD